MCLFFWAIYLFSPPSSSHHAFTNSFEWLHLNYVRICIKLGQHSVSLIVKFKIFIKGEVLCLFICQIGHPYCLPECYLT